MCDMQKYIPLTFFNAHEHYLIHQVEGIKICGPIHTRPMWVVEGYLKSLKVFIRQRSCSEDSMVEGYMEYQSLVYISEHLPKVAIDINVPFFWDVNSINKFKGEVLLGKGRKRKMKGNWKVENYNTYFNFYSSVIY